MVSAHGHFFVQEYISASEEDARKIPEAYYCIAYEYAFKLNDAERATHFVKKATRYCAVTLVKNLGNNWRSMVLMMQVNLKGPVVLCRESYHSWLNDSSQFDRDCSDGG